jgi:hypothetical protein
MKKLTRQDAKDIALFSIAFTIGVMCSLVIFLLGGLA